MTPTLQLFLIVSAALFSIGLLAALSRRHAIFILIGIEMMLAAANLNFIAFWRFCSAAASSNRGDDRNLFHRNLCSRGRCWPRDGHCRLSAFPNNERRSIRPAQRMNQYKKKKKKKNRRGSLK